MSDYVNLSSQTDFSKLMNNASTKSNGLKTLNGSTGVYKLTNSKAIAKTTTKTNSKTSFSKSIGELNLCINNIDINDYTRARSALGAAPIVKTDPLDPRVTQDSKNKYNQYQKDKNKLEEEIKNFKKEVNKVFNSVSSATKTLEKVQKSILTAISGLEESVKTSNTAYNDTIQEMRNLQKNINGIIYNIDKFKNKLNAIK